jgi:DNA replication protein DnaC
MLSVCHAKHQHLADEHLADAILDRILHDAHEIALKGLSRRRPDKEKQTRYVHRSRR